MLLSVFLAVTLSCEAFLHFCAVIHQMLLAALFFPHVLEFALHVSLFCMLFLFLKNYIIFFPPALHQALLPAPDSFSPCLGDATISLH